MSSNLAKGYFYGKSAEVGNYHYWQIFAQSKQECRPQIGASANRHVMLIADVPNAKQRCRNKGNHYGKHKPF